MFEVLKRALTCAATVTALSALASPARAGGSDPVSYPLYCQGKIGADRDASFAWATTIAKNAGPAAGQCSWLDRGARGAEIHSGSSGNYGLLCPVAAYDSALRQYGAGEYFIVNVAALPAIPADHRSCLTPTATPVALTSQTRPWPVTKKPGDGPKPANMH